MPIHATKEEAEISLARRRKKALEEIAARGDTVINDTSSIFNWDLVSGMSGYQDQLNLWTESLYQDLLRINNIQ